MASSRSTFAKEPLAKDDTESGTETVEWFQNAVGEKEALLLRLQTRQEENGPQLSRKPKRTSAEPSGNSANHLGALAYEAQEAR
ncbi:hypothetical protein LTR17_019962 [Elasticomyces elasticus]|nr:hypothetical protein LTR17_019962 [Elasticomyces elasticus]